MIGDVNVKLSGPTAARIDFLVAALDRQAAANERLAAAIEAHTALLDGAHNGPRG
ncbi:hypothetical protein MKUB_32790 [Mycobacterium kubicae]|uniref:Uncharacterized protein n=1 Tax=Mycobacterium kubicae TaxID=120959 RepID=A0AAX1JBT4_9MYCO|nr:hypothetical protein [Mycobacterium kubicae]MCV7095297.1 hypothetical protein [Mycobacterium kubicae]QPI37889.1 hypothetical protein I2456_27225 [Mycobacterium kubicae]GFG65789.1 hypothetical protein MKUB_32790 [Mycobacterium kubicae]